MIGLIFALGVLTGVVFVLVTLAIWMRKSSVKQREEVLNYNERSLEALLERNRISQRQLELMEKGAGHE